MTSPLTATATAANFIFATVLVGSSAVTAAETPSMLGQNARLGQKTTSRLSKELATSIAITTVASNDEYAEADGLVIPHERLTTQNEILIGEIRGWNLLGADWDGEGGDAPSSRSINEAVSFVHVLGDVVLPEPQLLASGRVSLFWNDGNRYAEIEFLGDGRIAYYIKRNGDKHKGVLAFDSKKMPDVFPVLLSA